MGNKPDLNKELKRLGDRYIYKLSDKRGRGYRVRFIGSGDEKTFWVDDYPSEAQAASAAKEYRNERYMKGRHLVAASKRNKLLADILSLETQIIKARGAGVVTLDQLQGFLRAAASEGMEPAEALGEADTQSQPVNRFRFRLSQLGGGSANRPGIGLIETVAPEKSYVDGRRQGRKITLTQEGQTLLDELFSS